MRCKCCDHKDTRYSLGDWYCSKCLTAIKKTIFEDRKDFSDFEVDERYYIVNRED